MGVIAHNTHYDIFQNYYKHTYDHEYKWVRRKRAASRNSKI